jgi:hypothetical protein
VACPRPKQRQCPAITLEFGALRYYITGMTAAREWMRRIIGPVLD